MSFVPRKNPCSLFALKNVSFPYYYHNKYNKLFNVVTLLTERMSGEFMRYLINKTFRNACKKMYVVPIYIYYLLCVWQMMQTISSMFSFTQGMNFVLHCHKNWQQYVRNFLPKNSKSHLFTVILQLYSQISDIYYFIL